MKKASTLKGFLLNLILIGLSLAAGLFLLEGYLRLSGKGGCGFYQPDPYLGSFHVPHKEDYWTKSCFKTWVKFNSRGLRDVEHELEKAKGSYRIIVLGDSYAEALQVSLEESFPRILERLLNEANLGKRFEVINLGISGFGTDQEYLSLRHYGVQYKPDLVILAFLTGNDIRNNYYVLERQDNGFPKPFFVFDANGNLLQLPFHLSSTLLTRRFKGLLAHFKTSCWILEMVYGIPSLHRWFSRLGLVVAAPVSRNQVGAQGEIPLDFRVYLEDYPPEWEVAWRITRALIRKTKEESEQRGAHFLLVSLTEGIQLASVEDQRKDFPKLGQEEYDVDKPVKILMEFSRKEKITYLPILPLFRDYLKREAQPVESLHYRCDGHWTPLAHALAGEAIFKKIVADHLYDRAP